MVELGSIKLVEHPPPDSNIPSSLQKILDQFSVVFKQPQGLPPFQHRDHAITLQPGTPPINARPYRYPQIQKAEIERLVREMLVVGIVQPSISPFSSPVLLVRKKDRGWYSVSTITCLIKPLSQISFSFQ